ncbi:MAG: helicase HerA-like domain-containing protein, partial [Gammaproteobacteria bacterium]
MREILIGAGKSGKLMMNPSTGNRHGMISGATGTGKTVTLQILAEGFSRAGVPVFLADIKGDLSGIALPGQDNEKITERVQRIDIDTFQFQGNPTVFWDIFGRNG